MGINRTDFKQTEIGPIPKHWEAVPLEQVLTEVDVRVRDFNGAGASAFPVLSLTKNQGLILQSERFSKRIATEDVNDYKVVQSKQIVYNPYVIWEGAVHILRDHECGLVSPVYPVWEAKADRADSFFVDHLLRMPFTIGAYNRFAAGAVNRRRSIRKTDFLSIRIPLPPLPEQLAIAHVLRTVQRAKEATEKVIAATRQLEQSLMRHLFTYGPVPFDQADQVKLKETAVGLMPELWHIGKVGDFAVLAQYGLSIRGEAAGRYPMLRMNNLQDGRVVTEQVQGGLQYVDLDDAMLAKFRLAPSDLLFNRTNSFELVGKTSLFDLNGDFVFASYLVRLRLDGNRLAPRFANYYLNMPATQARMKSLASRGVSQSNINATKLKGFEIPIPPLPEQYEIAAQLAAVDAKLTAEETRREALDALFQSLFHYLMIGKVRVHDLELPSMREDAL